jgi:hypothetical protein
MRAAGFDPLPTIDELRNAQVDPALARSCNSTVDALSNMLYRWGKQRGFELELGYLLKSGKVYWYVSSEAPTAAQQLLFISSSSMDGRGNRGMEHYEGIRRRS